MNLPIESPRYHAPEIQERFEAAGYDWDSIKSTLETVAQREEVDIKLQELEGKTPEYYEYLKSLIDTERKNMESSEGGLDFTSLSIDTLKKQAEKGVTGTKEALDRKIKEGGDIAEKKLTSVISSQVEGSTVGKIAKFFGIDVTSWAVKNGKKYAAEKGNSIGKTFVGFILSFLGIKGGLNTFSNISENIETSDLEQGKKITSEDVESSKPKDQPESEGIQEELTERRNKTQVIGYMFLGKISGFPHEKGSPEIEILQKIGKKSLIDIQGLIFESNGNFKKTLGIQDSHINEDTVRRVVIGIIGPINREFLDGQLQVEDIDIYIGIAPEFNERAKSLFSANELQEIQNKKKNYREMSISVISRLSVMSVEDYIISLRSVPSELSNRITNFFGGPEVSEEIQKLRGTQTNNELYPKNVSFAFSHILTSNGAEQSAVDIIQDAEKNGVSLSVKDKGIIQDIVDYREKIKSEISQYSLGLDNFQNEIDKNLTWANIILLRNLLKRKPVNGAEGFDRVILFTWSHGVLSGVSKGNYETKILEYIADGSRNDSNLLTVVAYRVLELERNIVYEAAKNTKGRIDGVYEAALGLDEDTDPWLKWILVNTGEILTVSMALKLLRKTPVMRAVLLATTGVLSVSIFFGIKEGLHNRLDSDIGLVYAKFLQEIAPQIGEESVESLAKSITSGNMGILDIYRKLEALGAETLEREAKKLLG